MDIEVLCPHCSVTIDLEAELYSLGSWDLAEISKYIKRVNPMSSNEGLIIPLTLNDDFKIRELQKLFNHLTLDQLENITKQFLK